MKNVGILQNCNMCKEHWMLCEYLLTLEGSLQCCELSCLLDVAQITSLHMLQGASLQILHFSCRPIQYFYCCFFKEVNH